MKKAILLFVIVTFTGFSVFASLIGPVKKETNKGEVLFVDVVLKGDLNLFSNTSEILPATISEDPLESYTESYTSFYISKDNQCEIIELTATNYKGKLKSQMGDNPDLMTKIGKKGYKFKDLDNIISEYNK